MNEGRFVFSQVVDFVPRYQFDKLVKKYKGDYRVHGLSCYNQFLHLLFGQLTACTSIRDICLCLKAHSNNLYGLGFRNTVDHTALTRANEKRNYLIYEELGHFLIRLVRPLYTDSKLPDIEADNSIFAIDSTSISISIKLCAWALGKYESGAIKMHTVLQLGGSIPTQIHVSDGLWHDSNFLDLLQTEVNAIYVADKAYVDLEAMWRIHLAGSYFIMRPKDNMRFNFIRELTSGKRESSVVCDYVINMAHSKSKLLYPDELRMVKVLDSQTNEIVTFITNNFEISAEDIAAIYRHRWEIESFFKWLKQNIVIKHLWGYSENAVRTHLWVAICAYLLLARIKVEYKSDYSITEIATLISVSALSKVPLRDLLTNPNLLILKSKQNIKDQLTLFD